MKVQQLNFKHFKRFRHLNLDFRDPETGLAEDLIVLVGQNGSGKSSVLQAVAALVGSATGRLSEPTELDWAGFDLRLANKSWARPIDLDIDVEFSQDEIEATQEYFSQTAMGMRQDKVPPGQSRVVTLRYNANENRVEAPNAAQYFQFQGRNYARMITQYSDEGHRLFERVGDVFWYTEQRTTNSLTPAESNGQRIYYDMSLLRRRLSDLFNFHERVERGDYQLRTGQRDLFADIERAYETVFVGHHFEGPVPQTDIDTILSEPWFYLFDGQNQYELGEMSSGERAIFPLIFDFANWNIHNSIILIDELELHLHPPLQQGLLKALRRLGQNNQFIITTHSDAVANIVSEESIRRLEL